jgi:hypothetical protein
MVFVKIVLNESYKMAWVLTALACGLLSGCNDGRPARVPVSGQVLIDGQPLQYGQIQFIPDNARLSGGRLDAEGRFTLSCFENDDGAVPGLHRVTVTAGEFVSPSQTRWHAPKKFANPAASGLTQQISEPVDDLVINLTWDGAKPFVESYEADLEAPPKVQAAK